VLPDLGKGPALGLNVEISVPGMAQYLEGISLMGRRLLQLLNMH
jgi:hypothetical protein